MATRKYSTKPRHPQPMQPMVWDGSILRFQTNAICRFIVDCLVDVPGHDAAILTVTGKRITYTDLMSMPWSDEDRDQWNQLHGYSVSGLPWRGRKRQLQAHNQAAEMVRRRRRGGVPK